MMDGITASPLTLTLAPMMGAYPCLSAAGLPRGRGAAAPVRPCRSSVALPCVGAVAILFGARILAFHPLWRSPAEVTMSAVAAWWDVEGADMLASPALLT
ncbi:hypothetical protein LWE61_02075 [Sphingobium sufflavum]|uniref:hypothetical protein n=1 Tax=Sphingobium sufflavum TaxID=1129547 RepID=UPI001F291EF5|nr:hypothetical protein [Sphingobium sufflavum]MCE7795340.1 hypothetical protein [Sphingobium sufflavum]